ncbi:Mrp/NBP35 family ATP-binding protein [Peptoniphilus mikwangii]|uniref:Mrp/NBP35 family ATP-binding protein n=1 Tax=Peptoniphilus mikwangii TaxID=1354300 RepID=UPI000421FD7C|nr:Mrp/NBP35 family ATP-binding protein [Peptoniphilus mikwangii]
MTIQKYNVNNNSKVSKIIGVVSGKGGVGKSFVCANLATELSRRGYKVGILDADITGPSVPKAFGISEKVTSDGENINPAITDGNIKIMSVNLILNNPGQPVLWRAPIVGSAIAQFFENVNWGELDYLFVDMPPGTGDVALTVFQSLPLDGVVIVTSPQDLVTMIVEKAVNMARMMNIRILGLVENMSYFKCPHCDEVTYIYGESKVKQEAQKFGIEAIATLPINKDFASLVDEGKAELINVDELKSFVDTLEEK